MRSMTLSLSEVLDLAVVVVRRTAKPLAWHSWLSDRVWLLNQGALMPRPLLHSFSLSPPCFVAAVPRHALVQASSHLLLSRLDSAAESLVWTDFARACRAWPPSMPMADREDILRGTIQKGSLRHEIYKRVREIVTLLSFLGRKRRRQLRSRVELPNNHCPSSPSLWLHY